MDMDALRNAAVEASRQEALSQSPTLDGHGSSSVPTSPSPPPEISVQTRKRRGDEDMSGYSKTVSREFKLRKVDKDQLDNFARLPPSKQSLWLAGKLLKISEHQEAQVAPEVVFVLSQNLKDRIARLCISIIIDPSTTSYIESDIGGAKATGPVMIIYKKICNTPSWGFTPAMADDPKKAGILTKQIQDTLTKKRAALKKLVDESLGKPTSSKKSSGNTPPVAASPKDIIELATDVVGLHVKTSVQVTVQLCVRLAMIRSLAALEPPIPSKAFWPRVDEELKKNRTLSVPDQSRFLTTILNLDMDKYGNGEDARAAMEEIREKPASDKPVDSDGGSESDRE